MQIQTMPKDDSCNGDHNPSILQSDKVSPIVNESHNSSPAPETAGRSFKDQHSKITEPSELPSNQQNLDSFSSESGTEQYWLLPFQAGQGNPQSYGLNNNNSFPPPLPYGSIGQPFMSSNNNNPFSHNLPSMPVNGPINSNFNNQFHQDASQRRAITAQHNFSISGGSMGGKPSHMRAPWGSQSPWPNGGNQNSPVSPWTLALQHQKVMNRGGMSSQMGSGPRRSPMYSNNGVGNYLNQHRYRRSPVPPNGQQTPDMGSINSLSSQFLEMMKPSQEFLFDNQKGDGDNSMERQLVPIGDGHMNSLMLPNANCMSSMNGAGNFISDRMEKFSRKVFVGGLPPDIDEVEITASFRRFGVVTVDWPHKAESKSYFPPKGYCFLLFQEELSVQTLIDACHQDDGKLYWCVTSPTMKDKPVQIRPWSLSDSDYLKDGSQPLDPRKTIFVGGVPRPLRAIELAYIIDNLYGGVCYAGIDTDPDLKYPKGAGRVAFSNQQSYISAISARFVQLHHADIDKRVEVKPYVLDDQNCDECQGACCGGKFAPFFCANVTCLQYYCDQCWTTIHSRSGREYHKPLVKEGADRPRPVQFRWH